MGPGALVFLAVALIVSPNWAKAQTIYPIDRAEILAGAKFDLKVEFAGAPEAGAARVTINGEDAAALLGQTPQFVQREEGGDHSAYWIRDAVITKPGRYTIEASAGDSRSSISWEVFDTPGGRKAKNVILFVGDGMTVTHRTAARLLSKGIVQGRYGGDLAMEDMPHMALVSTSGTDALVTDSANSAGAYTTGHKSCNNALGVYCARNKGMFDHPRVETITKLVKRMRGMAVGVVTDTEIEDATPAAMVSHTRHRRTYNEIVQMFFDAKPEVILGGGSVNFWPKSKEGSKRGDEIDYVKQFEAAGYAFVSTNAELKAAAGQATKLLGLFHTGNMDGPLDRYFLKKGTVARFPDQPDLTDQTRAALAVLSKSDNGFVLMVEAGRIDKYSHSLDWERAVYDTIMLDNAVKIAKDFAAERNDTLIMVVADHAHGTAIIGTYDDERPGEQLRDKLGTYTASRFPNYPPPNADGYPERVDVSRRLAFVFSAFPDYCETGRPYVEGENVPAIAGPEKNVHIANEKYCVPGSARRAGNLPLGMRAGVHAADEVVLTAMGPGAELVRGRMENTKVFRVMVNALGLGTRD